ncbi:mannose-6-phosphate isomerase, class I [Arthrobacter flavus]|uniref:mannose-6-phosphate isomerase n=1 Tax=Arthrobacter flavus TaxID=95172 RepID=A0ABW4Q8W7_9MICC
MYLLENTLRPYAWGSETAIAELLGRVPSGGPEAELWVGAHPDSPSQAVLEDGTRQNLDQLIASGPERALGPEVVQSFGDRLPFLLKVLAAAAPLSLQVHPSSAQAAAGFAAENVAGVPADAPHRNYRDGFHKPEMILALTPFEALCGFRPVAEAAGVFERLISAVTESGAPAPQLLTDVVSDLTGSSPQDALRSAFTRLLTGGEAAAQASEAVAAAVASAPGREAATVRELSAHYPADPGVLVALLLNRVSLSPGQAIYLPAGNVHAYLSGLGIEVMAASDNVLRGGLTPKHIDVPELLRTVVFEPVSVPAVEVRHTGLGQELYCPPFEEFALQRLELRMGSDSMASADVPLAQNGPVLVLAVSGSIVLDSPRGDLIVPRGSSAFVPANEAPVMVKLAVGTGPDTDQDDDGALAFAVTLAG